MGTDDVSDGRYPPGSKMSFAGGLEAPQVRKRTALTGRSMPPDSSSATAARKRSISKSGENKTRATFQKVDSKKPLDRKVEIAVPNVASLVGVHGNLKEKNENVGERTNNQNPKFSKQETRHVLSKNCDEKMQIFGGGSRFGSRVTPYHEESPQPTVLENNMTENHHSNHKDSDDLSLIRNQLVQIEKQQSSLLDLLQVCFHIREKLCLPLSDL